MALITPENVSPVPWLNGPGLGWKRAPESLTVIDDPFCTTTAMYVRCANSAGKVPLPQAPPPMVNV